MKYKIKGGNPIKGEIHCLGAKNFATKAMLAALLSKTKTNLINVPDIGDVDITIEMLSSIGVNIKISDREMLIDPTVSSSNISSPHSGINRIPILLIGVLLHMYNTVTVPIMGGCEIGERGIDFHIDAIKKFGGNISEYSDKIVATKTNKLVGTQITLPYPSVGATETCLFLGVLAKGTSIIKNIALEPEIMELITMLRSMGAIIYSSSNREIRIEGVDSLSGTKTYILGDRIEAASWACLAAASDGDIIVRGINSHYLGNFLSHFTKVGGGFEVIDEESLRFFKKTKLSPVMIETDVYPGFSTDWQQPFAILLTQARGVSIIHETVYENRFGYTEALVLLGANIKTVNYSLGIINNRFHGTNHKISAMIVGKTKLTAIKNEIKVPDLRAGLAYVIASAIADGETILTEIEKIERGYGDIVERLSKMNLDIIKIKDR